jgi:sugar lactone lactonase YvrE
MNVFHMSILLCCACLAAPGEQFEMKSFDAGRISVDGGFTNGVVTIESAPGIHGPWTPLRNTFSTAATAEVSLSITGAPGFYRALAVDLSNGREGFTNLVQSYNLLTTIAGAGGDGTDGVNKWRSKFEGGPATSALLSRPHIALADDAGNIYIADKDGHAIRKVTPDGRIHTVAGTGSSGNGPDEPTPATEVELRQPNGLWVRGDGTFYILDLENGKVRRVGTDGICETLFSVPGGILSGRGLWISDDESLAYVASRSVVKKWTPKEGVTDYASGFVELGNLVVDPWGKLVVTDRFGHRVYRLEDDGTRTTIAGADFTSENGGDGGMATETVVWQVRGVWFLPTGGYFLCTHQGSQVWYVDTEGRIHLFLDGAPTDVHAGDGSWFWKPGQYQISECRAITADREGNLLITEHDSGYVRKVQFLRHGP